MEIDEKSSTEANKMTDLSIEDFSSDIMLEIFSFLDKGNLKRAARVCQRWRNLIINSKPLIERLTLFFTTEDRFLSTNDYIIQFNKFLESKAAEFQHKNFKVHINEPQSMEIWDHLIDSFLKFVKDPLKVYLSSVPVPVVTRYVETYAGSLTHLTINYSSTELGVHDLPFVMPNLVTLELNQTYIPKGLIAPKLKELNYYMTLKNSTPITLYFDEFVAKCENLKILDTCCIPELPHDNIKFQLTELKITASDFDLPTFKSFLISQQKSLKNLELREIDFEYREFVDVIVRHTRVEELRVTARYDTSNQPQQTDDINFSVKKLKICVWPVRSFYVEWPHADYLIETLRKFRGLESLQLMSMDRIDMVFEQVDFSNLKSIELYLKKGNDLKRFNFGQIKLEKMEELKIDEISDRADVDNLVKIASFCPNLRILNLGKLNYIIRRTEFIKFAHFETIFRNSPKIDDLVIEGCANLLSSFMFSIITVKSNLKRLKVGVYCDNKIPIMLAKLKAAKFLCDISNYRIIGMKPKEWHELEFDYWKKISDAD